MYKKNFLIIEKSHFIKKKTKMQDIFDEGLPQI